MKVKCIKDVIGRVTNGSIYEVLEEDDIYYRISDDSGFNGDYSKKIFEIVKENEDMKELKNKVYNIDIFNWEDFKNGKIAVLCNTEELAKDFLDKCDEQGITLGTSVITNGIYSVVPGHYEYRWYQSNNIKVIQWEIKNNEIEKTFQEVIATIKEGEVWVSGNKEIRCYPDRIQISHIDNQRYTSSMYMYKVNKYKLQRKEYTFEEAFKAYEEGKEIESCESASRYKKQKGNDSYFDVFIKDWWSGNTIALSLKEIREKWYIND